MKKVLIMILMVVSISLIGCDFGDSGNYSTTELTQTTTAQTTITTTIGRYLASFETNGGLNIDSIYVNKGSTVDLPVPEKEGYTFLGWFTGEGVNDTQFTVLSVVNSDLRLYARWSINQYTINFDTDVGTDVDSITRDYATAVVEPSDPTREGYTFGGWYSDTGLISLYTFSTIPAEDVVLYANWTINPYSISYITFENYNPLNHIILNEGENVLALSLGAMNSSALTTEGRLFIWGANFWAQLGDGTRIDSLIPKDITSHFDLDVGEKIISASLATIHSSVLTSEGRVFTWGDNRNGQLGDGTTTNSSTPKDITSHFYLGVGETIITISSGYAHSLAITSEGRVFTWGFNIYGQLGDGTTENSSTPKDITNQFGLGVGETIISINLGDMHSSALTSIGRVFTWGDNNMRQLGDGTYIDSSTPVEITSQFSLNIEETIKSVSLGRYHSSSITSEGRIFTWGFNMKGQLGDGTTENSSTPIDITSQFDLGVGETIISINLGEMHSSVITSEGRIFTWGQNDSGQLGNGTYSSGVYDSNSSPIEITTQFYLYAGERIVSVSLGRSHSSALTSEGRIFIWGNNDYGQIGDGIAIAHLTPVSLLCIYAYSTDVSLFDYSESINEYIPTRVGYTFDGWYTDAVFTNKYTFTTMPAEDITLYGRWIQN